MGTAQPYDKEMGAYIFPYRNYDPTTMRWRTADPSGYPDGINNHFYACVPTMSIDPLGLATAELRYRGVKKTFGVFQHTSMHLNVTQSEYNTLFNRQKEYFNENSTGSYDAIVSGYEARNSIVPFDTFLRAEDNNIDDSKEKTEKIGDIQIGQEMGMIDFVKGYLDYTDEYKKNQTTTDYDWDPNDPNEANCNAFQYTILTLYGASVEGIPNGTLGWGHLMNSFLFIER